MRQRPISEYELQIFYNTIGEAVWHIQHLENALVHSLIIINTIKRNIDSIEESDEMLEKERKGTFGSIYNKVRKEEIIPERLYSRFDKLIKERNWLIHNSRTEIRKDLYNTLATLKIIDRISSISNEAHYLTGLIVQLMENKMRSKGHNMNDIWKAAENDLRTLRGDKSISQRSLFT